MLLACSCDTIFANLISKLRIAELCVVVRHVEDVVVNFREEVFVVGVLVVAM